MICKTIPHLRWQSHTAYQRSFIPYPYWNSFNSSSWMHIFTGIWVLNLAVGFRKLCTRYLFLIFMNPHLDDLCLLMVVLDNFHLPLLFLTVFHLLCLAAFVAVRCCSLVCWNLSRSHQRWPRYFLEMSLW